MRKILSAGVAAAALAMVVGTAQAADYEQAIQQLVVSGKVESWVGVSVDTDTQDGNNVDEGAYGATGGNVALSIPVATNLSIQMDALWERSFDALGGTLGSNRYSDNFQAVAHISWRDPSTFLIGAFGGFGQARMESQDSVDYAFVGGEAQFYLADWTLYGQGGFITVTDGDDDWFGNTDRDDGAIFGRLAARWFIDDVSRLQLEGVYANGDVDDGRNMDVFEWGVRYDRVVALPVVGDSQIFVGYRGNSFDKNGNDPGSFLEHTFMVGTSIHFGGNSMREFDRIGATLDAPNVGRWVLAGEQNE